MQELWRSYPPRVCAPRWRSTELSTDAVLARLLTAPFTADIENNREALQRRRRGLRRVLGWLGDQPGDTWQARWLASGADAMGNAGWWAPVLAWVRPRRAGDGVTVTSNLRVCAQILVCADVIRPSLDWVLTPRAPQNLVALMARLRDPAGFAELAALCDASPAGRTMKSAALRRAATILAVKGGSLREITVGDCLELSAAVDGRSVRRNAAMGFYQLLHTMGVFGPDAPSRMRAFATKGQLSPAQLIDRYGIECRPVRDVLVAYLQERQPMLDHTSLAGLAAALGGLFWRDLERHHPGIDSLHLPPDVAAAWKQRVMIKTRRVVGPDGQISQVRERRAGGLHNMAAVRAFYLDIAQWAMEEPSRWGPWAAPCPIRAEDLARQKELRSRKSRMDQRTRERLPVLPLLVRHVHTPGSTPRPACRPPTTPLPVRRSPPPAANCAAARPAPNPPGSGPSTRRRETPRPDRRGRPGVLDLGRSGNVRHTGIRIEELTELSHHSLIQYTLPGTGELVPLLQIAPSKTDTERLLVVSPELADVLAAIITRIRHATARSAPSPPTTPTNGSGTRRCRCCSSAGSASSSAPSPPTQSAAGSTEPSTGPASPTPPDSRCGSPRTTSAACSSPTPSCTACPRTSPNSSPATATSTPPWATKPSTPRKSSTATARSSPAAGLRPSEEYRVPTDQEWEEFLGHFQRRKLSLGTCGRSYATPASTNTLACAAPCYARTQPTPTAGRNPRQLHRPHRRSPPQGWLGEIEGLQISLTGARQKLAQVDQITTTTTALLGMPTFGLIAGRTLTGRKTVN